MKSISWEELHGYGNFFEAPNQPFDEKAETYALEDWKAEERRKYPPIEKDATEVNFEPNLALVDDYMNDWCGEPQDAICLIEEIKHPEKRSWLYEEFIEWKKELNK